MRHDKDSDEVRRKMQASDTHDVARADDETNLCQLRHVRGLGDGDGTDGDGCTR